MHVKQAHTQELDLIRIILSPELQVHVFDFFEFSKEELLQKFLDPSNLSGERLLAATCDLFWSQFVTAAGLARRIDSDRKNFSRESRRKDKNSSTRYFLVLQQYIHFQRRIIYFKPFFVIKTIYCATRWYLFDFLVYSMGHSQSFRNAIPFTIVLYNCNLRYQ